MIRHLPHIAIRLVLIVISLFSVAACSPDATSEPAASPPPDERPTDTPLSPVEGWTEASQPITVETITQVVQLGRLEVPGTASTPFAYAVSPDGTQLAVLNNDALVVWNLIDGEVMFTETRQGATRVYFTPDKTDIVLLAPDGNLFYLNAARGGLDTRIMAQPEFNDVADYDPLRGYLALAGTDGSVVMWDIGERSAVTTLDVGTSVAGLALAPVPVTDGTRLAVLVDDSATLWDWQAGEQVAVLGRPPSNPDRYYQIGYTSDGSSIVASAPSGLVVWEAARGVIRYDWTLEESEFNDVLRFLPAEEGSPYVVSGGTATDMTVWSVAEGQLAATLGGVGGDTTSIAVSPDGNLMFAGVFREGVTLWNLSGLADGTVGRANFAIDNENVIDAHWTQDGFLVLLFDARGPVEVWGVR